MSLRVDFWHLKFKNTKNFVLPDLELRDAHPSIVLNGIRSVPRYPKMKSSQNNSTERGCAGIERRGLPPANDGSED
jgi:hypothetical protein